MTTKDQIKNFVDEMGGVNQVRDDLLEYTHSSFLISSKKDQLTEKHPDHWIAMSGGEIVAIEKELDGLLAAIDAEWIDCNDLVVEFLGTGTRCMIL